MARKVSPSLVGSFVLIGIAVTVAVILLVTSARLFTKRVTYVLYFDDSLTGLDPGTAVKFRGVTVGHVKDVLIHYNQAPTDTALPVLIELDEKLLHKRAEPTFDLIDEEKFRTALERGLRGKLEAQSLLTGLLYVDLEFLPKSREVLHQIKPLYREIPTAPTEVQIFRLDFAEIASRLNSLLTRLDKSLSELSVATINAELTNLLASMNGIAGSAELTNTVHSANEALKQVQHLAETLRQKAETLSCATEATLTESRGTLREIRSGVQDLRSAMAEDGVLRRDLNDTVESWSEAARSVSELAELLTQHPNALISGKKPGRE